MCLLSYTEKIIPVTKYRVSHEIWTPVHSLATIYQTIFQIYRYSVTETKSRYAVIN